MVKRVRKSVRGRRVYKVQMPIVGDMALVYTRERARDYHMPTSNVAPIMGDRLKAFFEAELVGTQLLIGNEVPDPGW